MCLAVGGMWCYSSSKNSKMVFIAMVTASMTVAAFAVFIARRYQRRQSQGKPVFEEAKCLVVTNVGQTADFVPMRTQESYGSTISTTDGDNQPLL